VIYLSSTVHRTVVRNKDPNPQSPMLAQCEPDHDPRCDTVLFIVWCYRYKPVSCSRVERLKRTVITGMTPASSSFLCLLVLLHSFCSWVVVIKAEAAAAAASAAEQVVYTAYDDATWAVVTSRLSNSPKQTEYNDFMEQCRQNAGDETRAAHYCDGDEAHRLQMNMYQPRSVRACVCDSCEDGTNI
jgi:hypothetical protein